MGRLILLLVVVFCGSSGSKSASWKGAKKLTAELIFHVLSSPSSIKNWIERVHDRVYVPRRLRRRSADSRAFDRRRVDQHNSISWRRPAHGEAGARNQLPRLRT